MLVRAARDPGSPEIPHRVSATMMSETHPNPADHRVTPRRIRRRVPWLILLMIVLWCTVMRYRNTIRAHWWAHQLAATEAPEARSHYARCLVSLGDRSIGAVAGLLDEEAAEVRLMAVELLGRNSSATAVDALLDAGGDADLDVRRAAIRWLALSGDARARDALEAWARERDARTAMIVVSNYIGESLEATVDFVGEFARAHPDAGVRAEAIVRLEELGSTRAVPALIDALRDDAVFEGHLERDIRAAAMWHAVRGAAPAQRFRGADATLEVESRHVVGDLALSALIALTERPASPDVAPTTERSALAEDWRTWWTGREGE